MPRNLQSRRIWEKRLTHYLAVFERALVLLGQEEEPPILEKELNRRLDLKLVDACVELDPKQRLSHPVREAKNPPDPEFDTTQTHEEKIPDFQWEYIDQSKLGAPVKRSFAIECKRIGKPVKGHNLNKEYVTKGVLRFQQPDWKYGDKLPDGAMIGYIQAKDHDKILAEINNTLRGAAIDELAIDNPGWWEGGVSKLAHCFTREFPVSPFRLFHFWLDIRRQ